MCVYTCYLCISDNGCGSGLLGVTSNKGLSHIILVSGSKKPVPHLARGGAASAILLSVCVCVCVCVCTHAALQLYTSGSYIATLYTDI